MENAQAIAAQLTLFGHLIGWGAAALFLLAVGWLVRAVKS